MRISVLLSGIVLAATFAACPAFALNCETDPANFAFAPEKPGPTFRFGTLRQVDQAYALLAETIGDIGTYPRATIFLTKGYRTLTSRYCEGDDCTNDDILSALQSCSARAKSAEETCYPLAIVHEQKLYCLLAPRKGDPAGPYVPFRN